MRPHVSGHERFEQRAVIVVASPLLDEDLSHGATFRESPGLKGGDQGGLLDHSVLEGEQAEKEAMRSVGAIGHGGLSRPGSNGAKGKREPSSGLSTERWDQRAIIHGNRRPQRIEVGNWFWATSPLAFFPIKRPFVPFASFCSRSLCTGQHEPRDFVSEPRVIDRERAHYRHV